jgi:hypothetical protein
VCVLLILWRPLLNLLHILVPPLALQTLRCTASTLDSLVGPPASVNSVLLGSPVLSPQLPPRSRISCCSPQESYVPGNPSQISDDQVPIPRLHVTSSPQLSAHDAATSPANSDDEVPIQRFSHYTALVSCYGDAEVPLPNPGVSCLSFSPSPPIVCPQPALKADLRSRCPLGYD